jgi:hypothetical protein
MTAFSPSWRERCPDNPQGVKNLFATFHRVRKSLHCMEQHWLDEYPSSTPIVRKVEQGCVSENGHAPIAEPIMIAAGHRRLAGIPVL